jgi:hypothetical protein
MARGGFAPPLGSLLERVTANAHAGDDVHALALRPMHAGALAALLREAALARDWPRAAGALARLPRDGMRVRACVRACVRAERSRRAALRVRCSACGGEPGQRRAARRRGACQHGGGVV